MKRKQTLSFKPQVSEETSLGVHVLLDDISNAWLCLDLVRATHIGKLPVAPATPAPVMSAASAVVLEKHGTTLPETNMENLKWMVGIRSFPFVAQPIFRRVQAVSFREGTNQIHLPALETWFVAGPPTSPTVRSKDHIGITEI